jgi:twitching motility protein PilU
MIDIQKLLISMVEQNASDLYLTVGAPPLLRIDGACRPVGENLKPADTRALCEHFMSEGQQAEFREKQEMNLAHSISGLGRYRVNAFMQRGQAGLVIRLVKINIPSLESLLLPEALKDLVMLKRGLVLITGPTGTGKSTTLAAMIDHRNEHETGHILTVEDPIEFVHQHKKSIVTQREVGMDTENYGAALRNALRQAPDVVLIGEIRDAEAMDAALTFVETGHLVLGTLHTTNANQTIDRIVNFFPKETHNGLFPQLALNLAGICCQRLLPDASGTGRRAALEILVTTPRIRDLIAKGEVGEIKTAMDEAVQEGCQTFDQALYNLLREGAITLEEALKNAESANNLKLKLKLQGVDTDAAGADRAELKLTLMKGVRAREPLRAPAAPHPLKLGGGQASGGR